MPLFSDVRRMDSLVAAFAQHRSLPEEHLGVGPIWSCNGAPQHSCYGHNVPIQHTCIRSHAFELNCASRVPVPLQPGHHVGPCGQYFSPRLLLSGLTFEYFTERSLSYASFQLQPVLGLFGLTSSVRHPGRPFYVRQTK